MLRIGVLGDRHVSAASKRYRHALDIWDFAVTDAIEHGATAFVGLGDVVEDDPNGEERMALGRLYKRMAHAGPTYEVLGNHEAYDALRWLQYLDVHVVWDSFLTVDLGEAILALAPYARKGRPPYDDLGEGDTVTTNLAAATKVAAFIRSVVAIATKPVIVAGHWAIEGTKLSNSEYEIHTSQEMVLPLTSFEGAALTIGAHIHRAQELTPRVIVAGSMHKTSFAEAADVKSYPLVTVKDGRVTWERRPLPAHKMEEHSISLDELKTMAAAGPIEALFKDLPNTEVKLIVDVPANQIGSFDPSLFDAARAISPLFTVEKNVINEQRARAPEIAKSARLRDQFLAWGEATNLELDEARKAKLLEKIDTLEGTE